MSSNITLDGSVTVKSIVIDPDSSLNLGSYTLTLTSTFDPTSPPGNAGTLAINQKLTAGTGTVKLEPTGGDNVEIWTSNQTAFPTIFNNLIMGTITSDKTVYIGRAGYDSYLTVNGDFISGSGPSARVTFVKGGSSYITNPVTSYYCASNGGITNINCQPGGFYGSSPSPGATINLSGAVGSNPSAYPSASLSVSETGVSTLDVTNITITGTDATKFSRVPNSFSIADGGAAKTVTVTCNGSSAGTYSAQLEITHNGGGSPATYPLSCTIGSSGSSGGSTPISASVESDIALAITFLGMMFIAMYKLRKTRKA